MDLVSVAGSPGGHLKTHGVALTVPQKVQGMSFWIVPKTFWDSRAPGAGGLGDTPRPPGGSERPLPGALAVGGGAEFPRDSNPRV